MRAALRVFAVSLTGAVVLALYLVVLTRGGTETWPFP